jgi:hypothetical protein
MKLSDISLIEENYQIQRKRLALIKPEDISPLSAYYTLKELYGEPNGSIDEDKSQWGYYLKVPGAFLSIYDWKIYTWSIAIYEDENTEKITKVVEDDTEKGERIGQEFLELLKKNTSKANGRIKEASSKAKDFILQNPFFIYYNSAVNLIDEIDEKSENSSDYFRSAFFLFIASFEGLLNLIYELYVKKNCVMSVYLIAYQENRSILN